METIKLRQLQCGDYNLHTIGLQTIDEKQFIDYIRNCEDSPMETAGFTDEALGFIFDHMKESDIEGSGHAVDVMRVCNWFEIADKDDFCKGYGYKNMDEVLEDENGVMGWWESLENNKVVYAP